MLRRDLQYVDGRGELARMPRAVAVLAENTRQFATCMKDLIINAARQEHVPRGHRRPHRRLQPADRPGRGHRRPAALQRRPHCSGPRHRRHVRRPARHHQPQPRRAGRPPGHPRRDRRGGRAGQRLAVPGGAGQAVRHRARVLAARRGEVTPTMKVKGHAITAKYASLIDSLYAAAEQPA